MGNQRMNLIKGVVCVWPLRNEDFANWCNGFFSDVGRQKAYGIRCSLTQQQNWMTKALETLLHSIFVIQFFISLSCFFIIAVARFSKAAVFYTLFNALAKVKNRKHCYKP